MDYKEIKRRDAEFAARKYGTHKPPKSSVKKDSNVSPYSLLILVLLGIVVVVLGVLIYTSAFRSNNSDVTPPVTQVTEVPAQEQATPSPAPTPEPTAVPTEPPARRGSSQPIPQEVRASMMGISYPADGNARVSLDSLSYLTIPYHDFNGQVKNGNMIVAADLAEDVLDIFAELYDIGYPIENMELIDKYYSMQTEELDSLDRSSMGRNNTSAFCYRVVSCSSNLSNHAYGRAIDLNPRTNPWVSADGSVSPRNAKIYADRNTTTANMEGWRDADKAAFIGRNTEVYRIFTAHGWEWGGEIWSAYNDYQHFQKTR